MNFSKTSKLSKLLSMILVLAMMVTLFAGCKKGNSTEDTSEPAVGPNLTDTNPPSEAESQPAASEPVEINENMATVLSQINIRSAPSTESTVIGNLYAGDKVEVSRREGVGGIDWAYITSPIGGWIVMEYVQMDYPTEDPVGSDTSTPAGDASAEETEPDETTDQNIKGVITANGLNVRSEASQSSKIQGSYSKGDVVTILEVKNGWGRTDKGWVKMDYVSTSGSSSNTGTTSNTDKDKDNNKDTTTVTGNGSTTVQFRGIVTASQLNIRSSASTDAERVGSLNYGSRVEILEKSGNWGRTKDGWISLDYIYQDGTTGSKTAKGIVTGNELNIRSGPGTGYQSVGSMNYGERVTILEQFTYNGVTWGCTKSGWISMQYVYVDGTGPDDEVFAVVTGDELNIRSGPGTGYESVGSLEYGDEVTILFELEVGDTTWGNISKGWICMDYVELT